MNLIETFWLALKNIWSNKLRTMLTMLGIIIGVTAVTVIVGLGNGMAKYMSDSFAYLGTNTLSVSVWGRGTSRNASVDDLYAIARQNPDYFEAMSPLASTQGAVRVGTTTHYSTASRGVSEDYLAMKDYTVAQGRGLQYMDMYDRKAVCVIGAYLAENDYNGNALGKSIKIGTQKFTIVGVLAQQSDTLEAGGTDDCVFVPYSTAARLWNGGQVDSYVFTVTDENKSSEAKTIIENALYAIFADSYAYNVTSMTEMLETMTSMINVVIAILTVIAGISLVVGGIGIMNIMLVSVTERTREIGIRKALGAKERTILNQFVIEAATTSALGGVIGIALGEALCAVGSKLLTLLMDIDLTILPSTTAVLGAFGISAGIGVLFGYLPARKAARLNPIDALRYD
jgi:putative ABC transport system permease protein